MKLAEAETFVKPAKLDAVMNYREVNDHMKLLRIIIWTPKGTYPPEPFLTWCRGKEGVDDITKKAGIEYNRLLTLRATKTRVVSL